MFRWLRLMKPSSRATVLNHLEWGELKKWQKIAMNPINYAPVGNMLANNDKKNTVVLKHMWFVLIDVWYRKTRAKTELESYDLVMKTLDFYIFIAKLCVTTFRMVYLDEGTTKGNTNYLKGISAWTWMLECLNACMRISSIFLLLCVIFGSANLKPVTVHLYPRFTMQPVWASDILAFGHAYEKTFYARITEYYK